MRTSRPDQASLFHGSCPTHEGYGFSCADFEDFRRYYSDTCALCGVSVRRMVIDHDHMVSELDRSANPVRGLLCIRCNSGEMSHVDRGIQPIDSYMREYLLHPYRLRGERLPYDPRVHVAVADLASRDREELRRLRPLTYTCGMVLRVWDADPRFEHQHLAQCVVHGDLRPVMRLIWLLDRGLLDVDIADPSYGGRREPRHRSGVRLYIHDRDERLWRRAQRFAKARGMSLEEILAQALWSDPAIQAEVRRGPQEVRG